jgi:long-subunit fatty acid transport protein
MTPPFVSFHDPQHPSCDPNLPLTCGPDRMRDEDPRFDSIATLKAKGRPAVTGVLGVMVRALPKLWLGGSLRPGYRIKADGTLDIELSRFARVNGVTVSGNEATLQLDMPWEARLGGRYQLTDDVEIELDGTYEGWHSVNRFVITPNDIRFNVLGSEQVAAPFIIEKHWQDAYSVRLGAEWKLPWALPLVQSARIRAGLLYETSAIPLQYTSVDFPSWERFGETLGLSVGTRTFEVVGSFSMLQQPTREVTDSQVVLMASDPNLKPGVIGNGRYTSSFTLAQLGVRAAF